MFRRPGTDDHDTEDLLGRAIRALPDPQISPEFNDRIHRELSQDVRVNAPYWRMLRPGFVAMGGSFAAMLALLYLTSGSTHSAAALDSPRLNMAIAQSTGRLDKVESAIDSSDLTSASARSLLRQESATPLAPIPGMDAAPSNKPARPDADYKEPDMPHQSHEDTRPIRLICLPGIALGAVAALLVWPQTHRLVASQLRLAIPTNQSIAAASPAGYADPAVANYVWPAIRRSADEHTDDLSQQIAAATSIPPDSNERQMYQTSPSGPAGPGFKIARLRALVPRFEDQPVLYATILRYSTLSQVRITREETSRFLHDSETASRVRKIPTVHSSPAAVELFDSECAAGERLDPDNGFFPMMHAVGLFEMHRDAEALTEMGRAGACSHWNEYLIVELDGELTLQAEAFGSPGPLTRAAFGAAMLLPHLASVRAVAKLALYEAVEAEQAGNLADGLRIRTSVRQVGSLMRSDSRNLIGVLVGMSLVRMSLMRPGGSPEGPKADVFKQKEARDLLLRNFDSYLASAGGTADSGSVHAEMEACTRTRAIISAGLGRSVYDTEMISVLGLTVTDMIVLSTVVWMAALGCLVVLLAGVSGSKPVKKLPRIGRFAIVTVLAFAAGTTILMLLIQQAAGSVGVIARLGQLWFNAEDGTTPTHAGVQILTDGYLGIIAVVPVLTVAILACLCLIWRAPVLAGVARGIRGCTVPLCSILIIGYAVLAPITSAYESRFDSGLTETFDHEGRALARMVGADWPGIVR